MVLKGIGMLGIAVIAAVLLFTFFFPLLTLIAFKYHIIGKARMSYEYNSADLALLQLLQYEFILNSKYENYKKISGIEYVAEKELPKFYEVIRLNKDSYKAKIENTLKQLTFSTCFKLSIEEDELIAVNCSRKEITWGVLPIPYNPSKLIKKIKLEVG